MTNDEIAQVIFFNVRREPNPETSLEWIRMFVPLCLDEAYKRGREDEKCEAISRPEEEQ